jgi:hypothetical protein
MHSSRIRYLALVLPVIAARLVGATFLRSEEWELHQESGVKRYTSRLPRGWYSSVIGLGGRAVLLHESEDIRVDVLYNDGPYEWGPSDIRVVHFDGPTPVERPESAKRLASSTEGLRRRAAAADALADAVDSNSIDLPDLPHAELSPLLDVRSGKFGARLRLLAGDLSVGEDCRPVDGERDVPEFRGHLRLPWRAVVGCCRNEASNTPIHRVIDRREGAGSPRSKPGTAGVSRSSIEPSLDEEPEASADVHPSDAP